MGHVSKLYFSMLRKQIFLWQIPPFIAALYLLQAQRAAVKTRSSLNPPPQELPSSLVQHPSSLIIFFFFLDLTPSSPHQPLLKFARSMISSKVGGEFTLPREQPLHNGFWDPCQLLSTHRLSRWSKPRSSSCFPGQRRHLTSGGLAREEKGELRSNSLGVRALVLAPSRRRHLHPPYPPLNPNGSPGSPPRRQRGVIEVTLEGSEDTASPNLV